ncbi:MAG: T9SS type A sorting domain-containing protein [Rhodothermaceae bacterium]|nr:T9SS type A sorting domain-containing protein [Rhodothermaceae bacterium]
MSLRLPAFAAFAFVLFVTPLRAQPFTFSSVKPVSLNELEYGQVVFFDFNRDGMLDLLATGNSANLPPFVPRAYVALSQGAFNFADGSEGLVFSERALGQGLWQSSIVVADFDLDGYVDVVVSGRIHNAANFETRPLEGVTHVYRGGASGSFASVSSELLGIYGGSVSTADIDGDGDEDLFITGLRTQEEIAAALYRNNDGTFESIPLPFEPLAMGDAKWADIDNDGDLDLALSGVTENGVPKTKVYRNDGLGNFTEDRVNIPGLLFSAMDWGDYDNDGDLDLALSGARYHRTKYFESVVQVWRNQSGQLSNSGIEIPAVLDGDVAWGDYDSDGGLDLLVVGSTDVRSGRSGRLYRNEEGNLVPRIAVPGVASSNAVWGDYDGDNDLDLVVTGSSVNINPLMRLYRNDSRAVNKVPVAPTGLEAHEDDGIVTLDWQAGADEETPEAALNYNIRIGTAAGTDNVMPAYSDLSTGRRLYPTRGNAGIQTSWRLQSLPAGDYFWSVQAIDQSFVASSWSEEGSFTITAGGGKLTSVENVVPRSTILDVGYPNPFNERVTIPFSLDGPLTVEISVYNVLGSLVKRLVNDSLEPGNHQVQWTGTDERNMPVAPGLYMVRMNAGAAHHVQHLTLIR